MITIIHADKHTTVLADRTCELVITRVLRPRGWTMTIARKARGGR